MRQRVAGDTASATSARVPCGGWPSRAGAMLPIRSCQACACSTDSKLSVAILQLNLIRCIYCQVSEYSLETLIN